MPAECTRPNQVDSTMVDGIFLQKLPDPVVFKAIPVPGAANNVYVEHHSLSGASKAPMKVVGGYLRNSDHLFDRDGGKELWLNCTRSFGKKRKARGAVQRQDAKRVHASAMQTAQNLRKHNNEAALRRTGSSDSELHWTQREAQARVRKRDTEPALWMGAPWRSLHDGLCTTQKLAFKWNEPGPRASTSVGHNGKPLNTAHFKNRQTSTGQSMAQTDYCTYEQASWQMPTNMVAQPKPRTWDDTIQRLSQPHETRHYRHKPARALPELSPLKWAHKKFSSEGNGSSG